ncbi:MAG: thiamine-phosphate kinase [Ktedonobacterales bacterium]|nr:thiamine-phosphate kinase [Ktedonobacterales bacterium]
MSLAELGEFGLIARLTHHLESRPDVVLGVGDDAAVLDIGVGRQLVATCDAQVEGQHFRLGAASPAEIGHKALAVNLSDIAAMGAEPLWALISLLLPRGLAVETLDGIYAGMRALARRFDIALVGGNIAATAGPLAIDLTLLGSCPRGAAVTRAGGRPGDTLLVVGTLGAAAAGLLAAGGALAPGSVAPETLERARRALAAPTPLVAEGRALAATGAVTAMLDVSDGLAADLGHLCERSGVGAEIVAAAVPIDPAADAIARAVGGDPLALALAGGEDYALLCAVRPGEIERARAAVRATGGEAHVIGALTEPTEGMRVRAPDGRLTLLEPHGWDHLRDQP